MDDSLRDELRETLDELITAKSYLRRCLMVMDNMAKENRGWRRLFSRWAIPHEPLREDARHLAAMLRVILNKV